MLLRGTTKQSFLRKSSSGYRRNVPAGAMSRLAKMASRKEKLRSIPQEGRNRPNIIYSQCVWAEEIELFYFSLYPVIFRRTILFFLKGYSNCALSRECRRSPITQKKPAIKRILNTPVGQIPSISGFLDMNNKRIDRGIVSMLRSIFDELGLYL